MYSFHSLQKCFNKIRHDFHHEPKSYRHQSVSRHSSNARIFQLDKDSYHIQVFEALLFSMEYPNNNVPKAKS